MTRVENRLQPGGLVMFTKCDVVTLCKQTTFPGANGRRVSG